MPKVPKNSTYEPKLATRPITFAPVMFSTVWIRSNVIVIIKIVIWLEGSSVVLNHSFESAQM